MKAGTIVGSFVYVVINVAGDVSGLFVSKAAIATATVAGGAVGLVAGTVAGTIAASVVQDLADGYFVPAVKTGSRLTGLGVAVGVGLATVAVVSLLYVGGHYIVQAIRAPQKADVTPIDYSLFTDGDFNVIVLESIVGNPEGPSSLAPAVV